MHVGLAACVGLLVLSACGGPTATDRARVTRQERAEQERAEQARTELAERQEQARADAALAAIVDDRGEPPRPLSAAEFEGVLAYYCGGCHSAISGPMEGPGFEFDTVEDLIALGGFVPGDAASSRIMIRIWDYEMPPPAVRADIPSVPPATADLLGGFIEGLAPEDGGD